MKVVLGGYVDIHGGGFYGPIKCNGFILWSILKLCDYANIPIT